MSIPSVKLTVCSCSIQAMSDLESLLSSHTNQSPPGMHNRDGFLLICSRLVDYGHDYGTGGMILDGTPFHSSHASPSVESFLMNGSTSAGLPSAISSIPSPSLSDRSLTYHSWPRSLPSPGLMRHLYVCRRSRHVTMLNPLITALSASLRTIRMQHDSSTSRRS